MRNAYAEASSKGHSPPTSRYSVVVHNLHKRYNTARSHPTSFPSEMNCDSYLPMEGPLALPRETLIQLYPS